MRLTTASLLLITLAPLLHAESHNPTDYPLRIHIFRRSETTFYHHRVEEEAKGEGRANLFENGDPKGIDFQFECSEKLHTSSGFETFPAKWKKPNEELVILQPIFGKTGSYNTCKLKVQTKDFAYYSRNGSLSSEPTAVYKQWMTVHAYDPEHGKDNPTPSPTPATPASTFTPAPAATPPPSSPQ